MGSVDASAGFLSSLEEMEAAVERLVEDDDDRPVDGDEIVRLYRLQQRIEAVWQRKLERFEREGGPESYGALSSTAWVRVQCRMAGSVAGGRVHSARMLRRLDQCRAAFEAGDISSAHVAVITRCAQEVGLERFAEGEKILVDLARQVDPQKLSWAARYLRNMVDPDGSLVDYEKNEDRRRFRVAQLLNGMFLVDGLLTAEQGAVVVTALDAATPPPASDDHRSGSQRRADALVELCRQRLNSGELPSSGGQKPHLVIFSSNPELTGFIELVHAGPIPRAVALKLTSDAMVAVDGQPGRRTVSVSLRRALERRDGGCQAPGCDRPVSWCEAHHYEHWADGGKSTFWNTGLYCRRHQALLFHDGYRKYKPPG